MFWFAFASLMPAALLGLACLWGGIWPVLAVVSMSAFVFFMDRAVVLVMPDKVQSSPNSLLWALGAAHFALLGLGIWAIGANPRLDTADKVFLLIGLGLYFGQISNSAAHELIHNAARAPRRLAIAIYGSLLFAHHASTHMRVHHVWAATPSDPSTAQLGEGFWRYLFRAWIDGFAAGKRAEDRLRRGRVRPF
jgi:alkane 1-monooxygenase